MYGAFQPQRLRLTEAINRSLSETPSQNPKVSENDALLEKEMSGHKTTVNCAFSEKLSGGAN